MNQRMLCAISAFSLLSAAANAQQMQQRRAVITGGGSSDRGKCTVEVVVDGAVDVEVRGNTATLRNLSGAPPQWRRFECTSPMPSNPLNLHFAGVDGRGHQELIRDPRNGGAAVVRIEDKDNGQEGYTFDLEWGGYASDSRGGQYSTAPDNRRDTPQIRRENEDSRYRPGWRDSDYYRRNSHGFAVEEAVRVCQESIYRTASSRFRRAEMHFLQTRVDDNAGRQDWVIGTIDVHRPGRHERFAFSCSVDFNTGRIRTADLDSRPVDW